MFGKEFEKGFSLVTSISYFVGSFIMPILSGIYELSGSFLAVFLFCGLAAFLMILLVIIGNKKRIK